MILAFNWFFFVHIDDRADYFHYRYQRFEAEFIEYGFLFMA